MPEVIDVFGIQASGMMRYVIAYALPLAIVFGAAFLVGLRGVPNVEDGFNGDDNSMSGDDPDFTADQYLRAMRKHGL